MPRCPDCKAKMVKRHPGPNDRWPVFWGCSNYPRCQGSRNTFSGYLRKLWRLTFPRFPRIRLRWAGSYPLIEADMEDELWAH